MNTIQETIPLPESPVIPGLVFRGFRGETDFPRMLAVIAGCKQADGLERTDSLENVRLHYQHLINCDPYRDMLFAEMNGQVIAYGRVFWEQLADGTRLYNHFSYLLSEWRGTGIGTAMLRYFESRLGEIAAGHPRDGGRFYQCVIFDTEKELRSRLEAHNYRPVRYETHMVRDLSQPFPEAPLPAGLEVRPVEETQVWTIFAAMNEAFRDHWGYREESREELETHMKEPTYNPALWKVAWDGDQVAGMVLNFVNAAENEEYHRRRGYTEDICVRRPWRKRGLARALLVQSMRMFLEMGMTETALSVDAENLSGALRLYQGVGYRQVRQHIIFRKPLE